MIALEIRNLDSKSTKAIVKSTTPIKNFIERPSRLPKINANLSKFISEAEEGYIMRRLKKRGFLKVEL